MDKLTKYVVDKKIKKHEKICREYRTIIKELYEKSPNAAMYIMAYDKAVLNNRQTLINFYSTGVVVFGIQAVLTFLVVLFKNSVSKILASPELTDTIVSSCHVLCLMSILLLGILFFIMAVWLHLQKTERTRYEIQIKELNDLLARGTKR